MRQAQIKEIHPNIDSELVVDLHLSLANEGEFYPALCSLYVSAQKQIKKGVYDSNKFINALQGHIAHYLLHGPQHFAYNRKFYPLVDKKTREIVAKQFEEYFLHEIKAGNSWIREN